MYISRSSWRNTVKKTSKSNGISCARALGKNGKKKLAKVPVGKLNKPIPKNRFSSTFSLKIVSIVLYVFIHEVIREKKLPIIIDKAFTVACFSFHLAMHDCLSHQIKTTTNMGKTSRERTHEKQLYSRQLRD